MRRIGMASLAIVAGLLPAHAMEVTHDVHPASDANVVRSTNEKLDFSLAVIRYETGSILVRMTIPAKSELQKASYLRLELVEEGRILLWTRLATHATPDGSQVAGFQIDESLVKKAFIGISYDAGVNDDTLACYAYRVPVGEYVTRRTSSMPAASRPG